jgi:hypothetical protein
VCAITGRAQESAAAKVVTLSGQVSVLRDNSPWALDLGDSVQPRQIIVTGPDGYALLQVSDGSTFEVFHNSRVVFRDNPGNWKDLLEVWLGRVKIQIEKVGGQPNYNKVRTPTAVISVRGTVFDVTVEDEDATTMVTVDEGQVAVQHALLPRGDPKILNPGEWIRVYKNQPLSAKWSIAAACSAAPCAAADAGRSDLPDLARPRVDRRRESRVVVRAGFGDCGKPGGCKTGGSGGGGSSAPVPPPPPPRLHLRTESIRGICLPRPNPRLNSPNFELFLASRPLLF